MLQQAASAKTNGISWRLRQSITYLRTVSLTATLTEMLKYSLFSAAKSPGYTSYLKRSQPPNHFRLVREDHQ
jgi:hypothetical protein